MAEARGLRAEDFGQDLGQALAVGIVDVNLDEQGA